MDKIQKSVSQRAYEEAKKAHFGQVDKAGVDYIKHPETVASFVKTDEEKAVAYLHDVIEDTELTFCYHLFKHLEKRLVIFSNSIKKSSKDERKDKA